MSKQIIFVAGVNHSGSTLVGCVLGASTNIYENFHIGEAYAFFTKGIKLFGQPKKVLDVEGGDIWNNINPNVGYENAYQEIFDNAKSCKTIIDSSKNLKLLKIAEEACRIRDYSFRVVLTYRPFWKIAQSDVARKKDARFITKNLKRYLLLKDYVASNPANCTILNVEELIMRPAEMTKILCDRTNIPYFDGKEMYWNYPSPHLYGAAIQRKHIMDPSKGGYDIEKLSGNMDIKESLEEQFLNDRLRRAERFFINHAVNY